MIYWGPDCAVIFSNFYCFAWVHTQVRQEDMCIKCRADWHAHTSLNAYRHKHMSDITAAVLRTWFCTVVSFLNKLCGLSLSPLPFSLPPLSLTYCTAKIHLLESVFSYYSVMEVRFHSITVHCDFKYLTFDNRNDFMALFPLSHFPTPPFFARSYQKGS